LDYGVDITTILSTSTQCATLSLKIFRAKFLDVEIPVLKRVEDTFLRESYLGVWGFGGLGVQKITIN
jgi:hypothetical protein